MDAGPVVILPKVRHLSLQVRRIPKRRMVKTLTTMVTFPVTASQLSDLLTQDETAQPVETYGGGGGIRSRGHKDLPAPARGPSPLAFSLRSGHPNQYEVLLTTITFSSRKLVQIQP